MTWGSVTELCYKTWAWFFWCCLWIKESMAINERMFSLGGIVTFLLSLFILIWSQISWIPSRYRSQFTFPWVWLLKSFSQSSAISNYFLLPLRSSICRFLIRFSLNTRVFIEIIYLRLCSVWIKDSNGDKEKKIPGRRKLFNLFIFNRFMPIIFRLVIRYHCCHFHIYPFFFTSCSGFSLDQQTPD